MDVKDNLRMLPEPILALGEQTGHAHRVSVPVYDAGTHLEFEGSTTVTHEEHGPIALPAKAWASGRVVEYDHFAEESRVVRD